MMTIVQNRSFLLLPLVLFSSLVWVLKRANTVVLLVSLILIVCLLILNWCILLLFFLCNGTQTKKKKRGTKNFLFYFSICWSSRIWKRPQEELVQLRSTCSPGKNIILYFRIKCWLLYILANLLILFGCI